MAWIALVCLASGTVVAACSDDQKTTGSSASSSSSGTGGTTESSSSSGSGVGGAGGSGAGSCTVDEQCAASGPCKTVSCVNGVCVAQLVPQGTEVSTAATKGDCKRQTCDASGNVVEAVDDADKPIDYNPCTLDLCTNGVPSNPADGAKEGTGCGTGQTKCVAGLCTGCNSSGNCPEGGVCDKPVCNGQKICGLEVDVGKLVSNNDPGDCFLKQCDATGEVVNAPAPNEVPPQDPNECDVEVCGLNGVEHNPVPDGVACGGSSECHPRTCMAGVCMDGSLPGNETKVGAQTAGDCKADVCDGTGGVVQINDDMDVPADPNPTDCTLVMCKNGASSMMPAPAGTACTQINGMAGTCSVTGVCS